MVDTRELSAEKLREQPVIDPWGHPYEAAELIASDHSRIFVFSLGPDGISETLGNDADDISPWTDRYSWLAAVHPTMQVASLFAVGLVGVVSSGSFLIGRRRNSIIQAQQAAT
jgi:hypothetical protein